MFNSLVYRPNLEACLTPLLPPHFKIKSSTLLQAYATFRTIQEQRTDDFSVAYTEIQSQRSHYPHGILQIQRASISPAYPPAFHEFLTLTPEDFLRYIVSDLVCRPKELLQIFRKIHEDNFLLLAHYIIVIKLISYEYTAQASPVLSADDSYDEIIKKIYATYCSRNKSQIAQLSLSEFVEYYSAINLYPLDVTEYALTYKGYDASELNRAVDILSNRLMLSREQQIEILYLSYKKNESAKRISERYSPYHFAGIVDPDERKKEIQRSLLLLAKTPPFDALSAVSIYKRNAGKLSASSVIKNDISLENGLIYSLFTSRTLLDLSPEDEVLVFEPSTFFIRKWLSDPATKGKRVTFIFQNPSISEIINFHYRDGTYAYDPGANVTFVSYEQWQVQLKNLPKESRLSHSKILLFACAMSLSAQSAWYQFIKENTADSIDIFTLLSSYEFEQAHSPFSSELDDPHMNILTVELIPQGINNSTSPRRKIFLRCIYDVKSSSCETTKISAYTLNTDFKMQALSKMFDAPVEVKQQNLTGLYSSIRKLYQQELLARKAIGRKNVAAISHEFTPDITIWCSKTYPPNNKNRPRLEAYVCSPANATRIESGFRERGKAIEETKKHTVKVQDENISNWLEQEYPFSVVQARHTPKEKSEIKGPYSLKPSINIRERIIDAYTPYLSGQNIALKTLWYLYPNLEDLYSSKDYSVFSQIACSEIGFLRVGDITPEICEDMLITCFPNDSREELLRKISILSTALSKAVDYSYCKINLLYQSIHDQRLRDRLFSQVRKALTKKHFTEDELRKAFHAITEKIRNSEFEYLGVMMRLLTGLDSNTICALKWKDIKEISDYGISQIVVTRQVTNDGKDVKGFDSLEDYLCFPCSHLLKKFLDSQYYQTQRLLPPFADFGDCSIVNSKAALLDGKKRYKAFPPRELEKLCREVMSVVGIEDRIIEIPDKDNGTKETNLNRYNGDFFRENFRYWGLNGAKLTPDEVLYLLGNKPETTFGIYYCDFLNDASQLMMYVKLLRLDAVFDSSGSNYAQNIKLQAIQSFNHEFLPITNHPLKIHIRLTLQNEGQIDLQSESKYGMSTYIAPIAPKTKTEASNG